MDSTEYIYLLSMLPNFLVGLAYLLFLKRPMKLKLLAALPSVLFLLIPILGLSLARLSVSYESLPSVLVWSFAGLGVSAMLVAFYNAVHIKTWLHLLQIVNITAGGVLWCFASLIMRGDIS